MDRQRILERERRWARPAAIAAILAAPLYFASFFLGRGAAPTTGLRSEHFRSLEAMGSEAAVAVAMRGVAFLCLAAALLYLFQATNARSERVSGAMIGFAFIGPVLLAAREIVGFAAERQVASDFVAQAARGGDVYTLLDDLVDASDGLQVAGGLYFPAILGLLIAIIYFSLQAMRVGLLTRFAGTMGMALGATLILIPVALALMLIFLWVLWLGFLFAGRGAGPRPPAWETGVAIPWPRAGEEPEVEEPLAELPEDGSQPGDAAAPVEAPRDRARRQKRKRRR